MNPNELPIKIKCTVATTVSQYDYQKIKQAARKAGISVSEYLRQRLEINHNQ